MKVSELDTPALTLDLDILNRNITSMAEHCRKLGIPLRSHTKTHKLPEVAHMQLAAGAIGICCQKLGEAEVMAAAGVRDIFVPYNIVGQPKLERLTRLVREATITLAVDSESTAQGISDAAERDGCKVRVVVELDTGSKRCGVQSPQEALELAQNIAKMPGLKLLGMMLFPSQLEAKPFLEETVSLFQRAGLSTEIISGGGTGHEAISKEIGCTDTRSGSYAYEGLKRISRQNNPPNPTTCAVRVICTVVSTPTRDRIIIDGGQKTFCTYPPTPYGYVVEHPEIKLYAMSVEHGHVDVSGSSHKFRVGERLSVIPLHQETTSNLHETIHAVRDGEVKAAWRIAGRGRVQ